MDKVRSLTACSRILLSLKFIYIDKKETVYLLRLLYRDIKEKA